MNKSLLFSIIFLSPSLALAVPEACNYSNNSSVATLFNDLPSRKQWTSTDGYCGEVSLISAGLYYGQYISQYDARALANTRSKSMSQLNQILLGIYGEAVMENNVLDALKGMHLSYEQFDNRNHKKQSSKEFLSWVKQHVLVHQPVVIGVYENKFVFGEKSNAEYDHIVPVFGIGSNNSLEKKTTYFDDDIIYLRDNELYTGEGASEDGCYSYTFARFQKSRKQANLASSGVYSLSDNSNKEGNYGIAVTGVAAKGVTLQPVRIATNPNTEDPEIKDRSNIRPAPQMVHLKVTVSDLKPETWYVLYKYKSFNDLPADDDFSKSSGAPEASCSIWLDQGDHFTSQLYIRSNEMVIYRAMAAKENDNALPPACVAE